ncbi:hypothetical protein [Pedobacter nyackensis]|uniref:Natural product n=1 Tax=Pedobacter nyackensis TaxID=475255 RepID=A0A1W2AK74_9SPHI|nr:hypothetical protein [Pedobacter nyackensis]SMC61087.1 hypothetical protein SAMN04488101_101694 [Pedobacter nyackensis]
MKKLSLNASAFQKGEVLTRSQLKQVLGGDGSEEDGSGDKVCPDTCGGSLPACAEGLECIEHAVYECSNKPKGCYLPGW